MSSVQALAEDEFEQQQPTRGRARHLGTWIEVLVSSLIGMYASLVLSIEAVELAANPDAVFACDISAKISCGAVGATWQAHLLGFPNAFLGLLCEPVITTVAVGAIARVRYPRWFLLAAQTVSSIGFVFAYWLFYQAYFVIGALCPWCLLITITTTLIFFSFSRINILDGNFGPRIQQKWERALRVYHVDTVLALIILAILASMVIANYL